jgi:hypothetical protein
MYENAAFIKGYLSLFSSPLFYLNDIRHFGSKPIPRMHVFAVIAA